MMNRLIDRQKDEYEQNQIDMNKIKLIDRNRYDFLMAYKPFWVLSLSLSLSLCVSLSLCPPLDDHDIGVELLI